MSATEDELTCRVVDGLERIGVEYMLVGSYASNLHGRPRDSFDADLVADLRLEHVVSFCEEFERDFLVDREVVEQSVRKRRMFNLIPRSGVFKVDVIPLRSDPFARGEFQRRVPVEVFGRRIYFASAEDVILSKLHWYRKGGEVAGQQQKDARDVVAAQWPELDRAYLTRWGKELGVSDLIDGLLQEGDKLAGD